MLGCMTTLSHASLSPPVIPINNLVADLPFSSKRTRQDINAGASHDAMGMSSWLMMARSVCDGPLGLMHQTPDDAQHLIVLIRFDEILHRADL